MIYERTLPTLRDMVSRPHALAKLVNAAKLWTAFRGNFSWFKGRYYPMGVSMEVASICNYQCKSCRHGFPEGKDARPNAPKFADYDRFRGLVDNICRRVHTLDFTGEGETLLHPRAYDLLQYAASRGLRVGFDTNGSVLDVERLMQTDVSYIQFALDGFSEQSYGAYRKPGFFEKVLHNVTRLCEAVDARNKRVKVFVKYLINRVTEGEVQAAENHFRKYRCAQFVREPFRIPFPDYQSLLRQPFAANREMYEQWAPRKLTEIDPYARCPEKDLYVFRQMLLPVSACCRAMDVSAYVNTDGNLYPCCNVASLEAKDLCFGNVFEKDFLEVFWGERANEIRRKYAQSGGRYSYCATCPSSRS